MKVIGIKEHIECGAVKPDHFFLKKAPRPQEAPAGGVLLKGVIVKITLLPLLLMHDAKGYIVAPFVPGEPMDSDTVACVERSDVVTDFREGDLVRGLLPWQECVALTGDQLHGLTKVDNPHNLPITYFLSVLGMPSLTAYVGLKHIAEPKAGKTAFVSAAAGAVGLTAGQLLKKKYGCKVVGCAGADDMVEFLIHEIGLDAAYNYKRLPIPEALAKHCPEGINIYYDNVGGAMLEAALDACTNHARIVACGSISQYDCAPEERYGIKNLFQVVTKRIKMQGFVVCDSFSDKDLVDEFVREVSELIVAKKLRVVEHITQGIENAAAAFCNMMAGRNLGKALVLVE